MYKSLLPLAAAALLLAACESSSTTDGMTKVDAGPGQQANAPAGYPNSGANGQGLGQDGNQSLQVEAGDRVFFELNSSELSGEARATLDKQAAWLKSRPNLSITVEGHCDERGTREYNLALGERRATAAKNYLVAQGVSEGSVKTISYGKERPAVPGSDETAWSQNRRAVTVVQ